MHEKKNKLDNQRREESSSSSVRGVVSEQVIKCWLVSEKCVKLQIPLDFKWTIHNQTSCSPALAVSVMCVNLLVLRLSTDLRASLCDILLSTRAEMKSGPEFLPDQVQTDRHPCQRPAGATLSHRRPWCGGGTSALRCLQGLKLLFQLLFIYSLKDEKIYKPFQASEFKQTKSNVISGNSHGRGFTSF